MFIRIKDGKVSLTEGAEMLPEVKAVKDLQQTLEFIYFTYSKESIYRNMLPGERKEHVKKSHKITINTESKAVQDLAKLFVRLECTPNEQLYENIKQDIQDLLIHIKSIPFKKTIIVNRKEGGRTIHEEIEVDNSEEKLKAIKTAEALVSIEEKLRKSIMEEKTKEVKYRRLFEDQDTLKARLDSI